MLDSTENEPVPTADLAAPSDSTASQAIGTPSILSPVADSDALNRANPEFHPLDPGQIRLEQISGSIFTAIVSVILMVVTLVVWFNIGFDLIWWGVVAAALLILVTLLYFTIFWPSKAYAHASWRLDQEGLEIRRGVIWRHRICIPLGRVQHADVSQGPLQRIYDIGTLTVHTAGTQGSSVGLEGLTHSVALELRDRLVRQRKAADVV